MVRPRLELERELFERPFRPPGVPRRERIGDGPSPVSLLCSLGREAAPSDSGPDRVPAAPRSRILCEMERFAFALFAIASLGAGCALVLDFDGYGPGTGGSGGSSSASSSSGMGGSGATSSTSTSTSTSTSSSGVVDCTTAPGAQCVPPAPAGWEGPVALVSGTVDKQCGTDWPIVNVYNIGPINAPNASCTCSCSAPQGGACSAGIVSYSSGNCMIANGGGSIAGACTVIPNANVQSYIFHGAPSGAATCSPVFSASVPAASFAGTSSICAGAQLAQGGCADGSLCAPPLPAGVSSRMCVYTPGDVACPDPNYSLRTVVYQGLDDSRGCSACTCGPAQLTGCSGTVPVYGDTSCVSILQNASLETCYGGTFGGIGAPALTATGMCLASGSSPQGAATPTGAITACCLN